MSKFGPFGDYVIPWYGREIARLEKAVSDGGGHRTDLLLRVEDMLVELDDLADEGYTAISEEFDIVHDARRRLSALHSLLYRPGDEKMLHPLPRADRLVPENTAGEITYGDAVLLDDYMSYLGTAQFDDIDDGVSAGADYAGWRQAVTSILETHIEFADSIFAKDLDMLVTLLRDMLPQYLIARWKKIPAFALPLGRSFLDRFGPDFEGYDCITGPLYNALSEEPDDFGRMWCKALEGMKKNLDEVPCMRKTAEALRLEAGAMLQNGKLLVVETGLQATMPLLFEGVFPERGEWFMFTAAPWLLDIFRERLFCSRYAILRPCETLACTDALFIVEFMDGRWYARETTDPVTRSRGHYEISVLKDMITRRGPRKSLC